MKNIYKRIQLTAPDRHRNLIEVAKIVSIEENNLIIERLNGDRKAFPANDISDYAPGQYIDIQCIGNVLKLIGRTPTKFLKEAKLLKAR